MGESSGSRKKTGFQIAQNNSKQFQNCGNFEENEDEFGDLRGTPPFDLSAPAFLFSFPLLSRERDSFAEGMFKKT